MVFCGWLYQNTLGGFNSGVSGGLFLSWRYSVMKGSLGCIGCLVIGGVSWVDFFSGVGL